MKKSTKAFAVLFMICMFVSMLVGCSNKMENMNSESNHGDQSLSYSANTVTTAGAATTTTTTDNTCTITTARITHTSTDSFPTYPEEGWLISSIGNGEPIDGDPNVAKVSVTYKVSSFNGDVEKTKVVSPIGDNENVFKDQDRYSIKRVEGNSILFYNESTIFLTKAGDSREIMTVNGRRPEIHIIWQDEKQVLIFVNTQVYSYNIENDKVELLISEILDYEEREKQIYLLDFDKNELLLNPKTNSIEKTGNKIMCFQHRTTKDDIMKDEAYQAKLREFQEDINNGNDYEAKGFRLWGEDVWYNGTFIGNANLPWAMELSSYVHYDMDYYSWYVEDNELTMYRYGQEVTKINLDKNNWKIIRAAHSGDLNYETATIDMLADEIKTKIDSVGLWLYNYEDKEIWSFTTEHGLNKLMDHVEDYISAYWYMIVLKDNGDVFYFDNVPNESNRLVGTDAIAIDRVGEVNPAYQVRNGDNRADTEFNGKKYVTYENSFPD